MANEYFNVIAAQLGISAWLFMVILAWSLTWKLIALWKSARKGSIIWFIVLALFNTVGVLEILYIFVFSRFHYIEPKKKTKKYSKSKTKKKSRKKKR